MNIEAKISHPEWCHDHPIGDRECAFCWSEYPIPCDDPNCDGLIHSEFGEEDSDMNYTLNTKCDVCGCPK